MEESTKVFAVLAAVVLALAPVTNGVVREAAKTAERVFLEPADWTPPEDPPEPPPNATPPEDLPNNLSNQNRTINASGAAASCNLTYPFAGGWDHDPVDQEPDRNTQTTQLEIPVNGSHLGLRVGLYVTNMTGSLDAKVYHEDAGEENAWFSKEVNRRLEESEIQDSSSLARPNLENGTYIMEINHNQMKYDELTFVAQYVMCERAAGGSG